MKRVRAVIRGWVQGVGFRASCRREAERLGLTGWVRNLSDGSVEALFEGPDQAVAAMLRWCEHGPEGAEVSEVKVAEESEAAPQQRSFQIRM
jgi:acylphosphatase